VGKLVRRAFLKFERVASNIDVERKSGVHFVLVIMTPHASMGRGNMLFCNCKRKANAFNTKFRSRDFMILTPHLSKRARKRGMGMSAKIQEKRRKPCAALFSIVDSKSHRWE